MPQNDNLSNTWKKDLGENWVDIHQKYLHTIGNLTLTGYNSELSDKDFLEKRDMEGGFRKSPFRLNKCLYNLDIWNEDTILKRAELLYKKALTIWTYPKVDSEKVQSYKTKNDKTNKENKEYTVEDHKYLEKHEKMRPLFDQLNKEILSIDKNIYQNPRKLYISYKTNKNFVLITAEKDSITLGFNIDYEKINDPKKLCEKDADNGWGSSKIKLKIYSEKDLDYALYIIKQAYEIQNKKNNV